LWAVALASIIGFAGNEGVAVFRIRVGREIGSAALVADGYHARVDVEPMAVEPISVTRLRPYASNARNHSKKQIRQIADSIRKFGFTNPVLISDDDEIIAGHGRVEAAKLLGIQNIPTLRLSHLDAAQRRAYVIADNKLALNAGWDRDLLAIELQALIDLDFGMEITGFSLAEVDLLFDEARESSPDPEHDADNEVPPLTDPVSAVTRCGDLWVLDRHRLLCGDSRHAVTYDVLLQAERAESHLHRPALQCSDRWTCVRTRPHPASRVRHGHR